MTALLIVLVTALVILALASVIVLDRQLKRQGAEVARLLQYKADPKLAALADMPTAELLYLRPEDDQAWNEHHGKDA